MSRNRPGWIDAATGLAALGVWALTGWALAELVHERSQSAVEHLVLVLPAALFPLATRSRARRSALPRWATLALVNAPFVAGLGLAAWAVGASLAVLAPVLAVTLAGSALGAFGGPGAATAERPLRRAAGVALLLAPAAVTFALVPRTAERMLTRPASLAPAPDVTLGLLDGSDLSMASLRGRVVVLNFWGVWCEPCVRELPELEAVVRAHRGRSPAAFVAVDSALGDESLAEVRDFVARHGLTIPVAYQPDRGAYRAFGVEGLPTTIVVDPKGTIRLRRVGYLASAGYADWLDAAIAELERGR